jgi:hypothetical protein
MSVLLDIFARAKVLRRSSLEPLKDQVGQLFGIWSVDERLCDTTERARASFVRSKAWI